LKRSAYAPEIIAACAGLAETVEPDEVKATDHAVPARAERERIADERELDRDEPEREEAVHERREHVLALHHAAVKQREARRHQHDKRRGNQQPSSIAIGHAGDFDREYVSGR
jgi:hypothetical protein